MTNEELRRQSGRDMEEARRASGRKMRDDMRALAENNRLERTLPVLLVRGKQPAKRGSAVWTGGAPSSGGGGGIASPLNEQAGTRKYHSSVPVIVMPDDGFFFYSTVAVKTLTFKDADNNDVLINLDPPTYESTP